MGRGAGQGSAGRGSHPACPWRAKGIFVPTACPGGTPRPMRGGRGLRGPVSVPVGAGLGVLSRPLHRGGGRAPCGQVPTPERTGTRLGGGGLWCRVPA